MGHYYIKETKAPAGFDLDSETHEVVLTWDAGAKNLDIGTWQPDDEDFKEQPSHGDYFLCTGAQLNPYIVNAKKVVFTYEKAPADAKAVYDVSADRVGAKKDPTTAATCTETGVKTYTCTICGKTKTEEIATTGHQHTEVRDAKEATCTKEGYTGDTYCKDCGAKLSSGEVIAKKDHEYEERERNEANCKRDGYVLLESMGLFV